MNHLPNVFLIPYLLLLVLLADVKGIIEYVELEATHQDL